MNKMTRMSSEWWRASLWASMACASVACGATDETAEAGRISVNELVASNQTGGADENDETDDWIELWNDGDEAVDLGGYFLSDKTAEPLKYELPDGLSIEGKSVLLLWADDDPEQGATHLPFKLTRAGEAVVLSGPDGSQLDEVTFAEAPTDESYARHPNGTGDFAWCATTTPGEENGASCP